MKRSGKDERIDVDRDMGRRKAYHDNVDVMFHTPLQ